MQTIYLDISNKGIIPCIQAKQSEVGRKFLAVITDNGVPYNIPCNSLLSVWYEGDTDAGNYSSIEEKSAFDIDGNKVTVELVAQMLLKPGKGELCLSVTHGDGGETNTWNIPYEVEYKPGAGSSVPTEYYTALTEAGSVAAEQVGLAKTYSDYSKEYYEKSLASANKAKEHADAAASILENNRVLLWETENPLAEFPAGSINAQFIGYKKIELEDNTHKIHSFSLAGNSTTNIVGAYIGASGTVEIWSRNISISENQITISDCILAYYRNSQWSSEQKNDRLKPYRIYGIVY